MTLRRRKVRVSHLTFAHVLKRMRRGDFTVHDLVDASGLSRASISELLGTLESLGLILLVDKIKAPGKPGPRERVFREVR